MREGGQLSLGLSADYKALHFQEPSQGFTDSSKWLDLSKGSGHETRFIHRLIASPIGSKIYKPLEAGRHLFKP